MYCAPLDGGAFQQANDTRQAKLNHSGLNNILVQEPAESRGQACLIDGVKYVASWFDGEICDGLAVEKPI